ncbi:MAG: hypothetical protein PHR44_00010 [Candidatus Omnitrophica bacterium]|nr:hypothetical protein [Candidatus Omnitrophota bacterium]
MTRVLICISVVCAVLLLSGCRTLGGFATGVATTVGGTVEGAVSDGTAVVKALNKADKWFQENYW